MLAILLLLLTISAHCKSSVTKDYGSEANGILIKLKNATDISETKSSQDLFVVNVHSNLSLSCSWELSNGSNAKVVWYFQPYSSKEKFMLNIGGRQNYSLFGDKPKSSTKPITRMLNESDLHLSGLTQEDSGWYECGREANQTVAVSVLVTNPRSLTKYGEIAPNQDLLAVEGGNVTLTCIFYHQSVTNETLRWIHRSFRASSGGHDVTKFSEIVDHRTSILHLVNVTWEDRGWYKCSYLGNNRDSIPAINITKALLIADKPAPPNNLKCYFYNYKSVNCTWKPGNRPHIDTTFTLQYQTARRSRTNGKWSTCKGSSNIQCHCGHSRLAILAGKDCCKDLDDENFSCSIQGMDYLKLGISPTVHFNVYAQNNVGTSLSDTLLLRLSPENLMLSPPDIFDVVNSSSHSVQLRIGYKNIWKAHNLELSCMIVAIEVTEAAQMKNMSVVLNGSSQITTVEFGNLSAYTHYSISAGCRSSSNDYKREFTDPVFLQTKPAIPLGGPLVTPGGFYGRVVNETREITVYWQKPPLTIARGKVEAYDVSIVLDDGSMENVETVNSSNQLYKSTFTVDRSKDFQVHITTVNKIGSSIEDAVINVPRINQMLKVPDILNVTVEGSCYQELRSGKIHLLWSHLNPTELSSEATTTIFWCKVNYMTGECTNNMQWRNGPLYKAGSFELNDIEFPCSTKVAISVEDNGRSSGLLWPKTSEKLTGRMVAMETEEDNEYITVTVLCIGAVFLSVVFLTLLSQRKMIRKRLCTVDEIPDIRSLYLESKAIPVKGLECYQSLEYLPRECTTDFIHISSLLENAPMDDVDVTDAKVIPVICSPYKQSLDVLSTKDLKTADKKISMCRIKKLLQCKKLDSNKWPKKKVSPPSLNAPIKMVRNNHYVSSVAQSAIMQKDIELNSIKNIKMHLGHETSVPDGASFAETALTLEKNLNDVNPVSDTKDEPDKTDSVSLAYSYTTSLHSSLPSWLDYSTSIKSSSKCDMSEPTTGYVSFDETVLTNKHRIENEMVSE